MTNNLKDKYPPCPKCQLPMTACEYTMVGKAFVKAPSPLSYQCEGWGNRPGCGYVAEPTQELAFTFADGAPVHIVLANGNLRPGRVTGHTLHPKLGWLNSVSQADGTVGRFSNADLKPRSAL